MGRYLNLEGIVMKQNRTVSASHKMRGIIDPYTLGFLISIIGASIAYIAHADKQSDDVTSSSTHLVNQADIATQIEDE